MGRPGTDDRPRSERKTMRGKSFALLVLALGCGLVASIGITQVISNRDKPEVIAGDTQAIFVALEDIGFGEPVTSQVLRLEQWPADKVPEGALTKIEDVEGRRTRTKLYAGEPLLEKKLFGRGASALGHSTLIPKGYRVVSVQVDKVSGSASMILPGDRVDVMLYLTRNPASGTYQASTRTILQDIKVFAVNSVVGMDSDQDDKSINAQTISLLVTPQQAQKVMLATQLGTIRLLMRGPDPGDQVDIGETTVAELFGTSDAGNRQEEQKAMEEPQGPEGPGGGFRDFLKGLQSKATSDGPATVGPALVNPRERHAMRIVSGGVVTHVVLESEIDESGSGSKLWWIADDSAFASADAVAKVDAPLEDEPAEEDQDDEEESSEEMEEDD